MNKSGLQQGESKADSIDQGNVALWHKAEGHWRYADVRYASSFEHGAGAPPTASALSGWAVCWAREAGNRGIRSRSTVQVIDVIFEPMQQ